MTRARTRGKRQTDIDLGPSAVAPSSRSPKRIRVHFTMPSVVSSDEEPFTGDDAKSESGSESEDPSEMSDAEAGSITVGGSASTSGAQAAEPCKALSGKRGMTGKVPRTPRPKDGDSYLPNETLNNWIGESMYCLSLAMLDHNIHLQDEVRSSKYGPVVKKAFETFRMEGARLDQADEMALDEVSKFCGFKDLPQDSTCRAMAESNSEVLKAGRVEDELPFSHALQQHLSTAAYLFEMYPQWNTSGAQKCQSRLQEESDRYNWRRTRRTGEDGDRDILLSLTHGAGMQLRTRMWSMLGWSRTTTYNTRVAMQTFTLTIGVHRVKDNLRQNSMRHATAMLAHLLPVKEGISAEVYRQDMLAHRYRSHLMQSLSLLEEKWHCKGWHQEGKKIALVQLDDHFGWREGGAKPDGKSLSNFVTTASDREMTTKTAIGNLRVLHGTDSTIHGHADWKRLISQLTLNAEWVRRTEGVEKAKFKEGTERLSKAHARKVIFTSELVGVLSDPPEVKDIRDCVNAYCDVDWKNGWHFEPLHWGSSIGEETYPDRSATSAIRHQLKVGF